MLQKNHFYIYLCSKYKLHSGQIFNKNQTVFSLPFCLDDLELEVEWLSTSCHHKLRHNQKRWGLLRGLSSAVPQCP